MFSVANWMINDLYTICIEFARQNDRRFDRHSIDRVEGNILFSMRPATVDTRQQFRRQISEERVFAIYKQLLQLHIYYLPR